MIKAPTIKPNMVNPPDNEPQLDPGPLVDVPAFPEISQAKDLKTKTKPKELTSRVLRIGRKLGSKQGEG